MTVKDKRKIILTALEKVLKDRRFDEVTVDEVATEAGVGKGTVYRYFGDKENLFFEMVRSFLVEETDALMVVAASALGAREKLIRMGEEMSLHIQNHGEYIRKMHGISFQAGNSKHAPNIMIEHHQRLYKILTQVLRDAEEDGLICSGSDYNSIICIYKGMIMARSMTLIHENKNLSVEGLVDLLMDGIGKKD